MSLEISFDEGPRGVAPLSVDLISPTMPAHGIARYPVTDGAASLDIPMEGRWAIYVNLDEVGANSAEFIFDVAAESDGAHDREGDGGALAEGR